MGKPKPTREELWAAVFKQLEGGRKSDESLGETVLRLVLAKKEPKP
jgi:hypothetical protein